MVATWIFAGYIITLLIKTQLISAQALAGIDVLSSIVLSLTFVWLGWVVFQSLTFKPGVSSFVRKMTQRVLMLVALLIVIAACFGYYALVKALVPNLIITFVLILIMWDVTKLFNRLYFLLSAPSQVPSKNCATC